jgi:glutamine synthetase
LRVIPGSEQAQRLEFRLGSADANPYLVSAALIASGLLGIEQKLQPSQPLQGNAYEQEADLPSEYNLASNLRDAVRDFQNCTEAKDIFGNEFVDHYVTSRLWEVREYERQVTDWQLKRYLEII